MEMTPPGVGQNYVPRISFLWSWPVGAEQKFRSAGVRKSPVPAAPGPRGEVTKTLSGRPRRGYQNTLGDLGEVPVSDPG